MKKSEVIEELAKMYDDIENTVDELNKNPSDKDCKELVGDLMVSLAKCQMSLAQFALK